MLVAVLILFADKAPCVWSNMPLSGTHILVFYETCTVIVDTAECFHFLLTANIM